MVGFPFINKQLFGTRAPLGSIYAVHMASAGIGMAIGGWLGGWLFDFMGNYTGSLLISLIVGCVGVPMALALPRHGKTPPGSLGEVIPTPTPPIVPASPQ